MKTILVPTGNHDAMRSTLETALLLARRCDSYINLDIPGKSQHVAPESVGQEQHRRRRGVARLQGGLECREPAFRVGLRRKARAIVDKCHRQILLQRRRLVRQLGTLALLLCCILFRWRIYKPIETGKPLILFLNKTAILHSLS